MYIKKTMNYRVKSSDVWFVLGDKKILNHRQKDTKFIVNLWMILMITLDIFNRYSKNYDIFIVSKKKLIIKRTINFTNINYL